MMIDFSSDMKEDQEGEEKVEEERLSEEGERDEEVDLQLLLDRSNFQVTVLEAQLKATVGEIKYLRTELSSSQLDLLSSRSEVQVLLQEVSQFRREKKEQEEEFPGLLLSSLDRLCAGKQQQLFLINGIHNSIEKKKSVEPCGEAKAVEEEGEYVPKLVEEEEEEEVVLKRTNPPLLKLELKKSYEFNPGLWTARHPVSLTPLSCLPSQLQAWHTPTTPTPSSALRPSLSLHNLASVTFTEVLVPCIQPPPSHQVSPPSSCSPRSPDARTPSSPSSPSSFTILSSPSTPSLSSPQASKSSPIPLKPSALPSKMSPQQSKIPPKPSPCPSKTSPTPKSQKTPASPRAPYRALHQSYKTSPQATRPPLSRALPSPSSPLVHYPAKRRVHKSLNSLEEAKEQRFYLHCKKEISV